MGLPKTVVQKVDDPKVTFLYSVRSGIFVSCPFLPKKDNIFGPHKTWPNDLIVLHLLGIFFFFSDEKSQLPGFQLTSQRVRRITRLPTSYRGDREKTATVTGTTLSTTGPAPAESRQ